MNRFPGNSTERGGVVHESYVRSAWFPVAVNRIMEWTPLHGSQLSQSYSGELVLPETRLNEGTKERFANDSSWRTESRELGHGNESLNPPLIQTAQWRRATYRSDLLPRYGAKTRDLVRDVPDAEIFFFF